MRISFSLLVDGEDILVSKRRVTLAAAGAQGRLL
jgi:hypothetical protein